MTMGKFVMRVQQIWFCILVIFAGTLFGCGAAGESMVYSSNEFRESAADTAAMEIDFDRKESPTASAAEASKRQEGREKSAVTQRKIIQTGEVALIARDFDLAIEEVNTLVQQFQGILSNHNIDMQQSERRFGRWTIRVPSDQFDGLYEAVQEIGNPTRATRNAQDVTAEYIDLEARIASKKQLEARVLELLNRPDDKIQHVIEVEKELSRIRTDIESMEGQLRYLKDRVSLSTLTLTIQEQRDYVPPQAPTLDNRISEQWLQSLTSLRQFGEGTLLFAVGIAPWLILVLVFLVLSWLVFRIRKVFRSPSRPKPGTT